MIEGDRPSYEVAFVPDFSNIPLNSSERVFIAPGKEKWNDFGFRIRVDILVQPSGKHEPSDGFEFGSYFAILDAEGNTGDVSDLVRVVGQSTQRPVPADELPGFFTMLPDLQAYRSLIDRFGVKETSSILLAIHDLVATEESQAHPDWLGPAKETKVFEKGFLRFSESYFAWKNAGSILLGEQFEELGSISDTIRIRFTLAGRPNPHDLTFRFSNNEEILPKRISVVIGKNGVGKSQALARIAKSALFTHEAKRPVIRPDGSNTLISTKFENG